MKRILAAGTPSWGACRRIAPLASIVLGALVTLVLFTPVHAAPAQQYRLAVVELRNEAELRPSEIAYLTDQARTQASKALPGERFLVMTRESIVALLPPGKTLADCAKGQCEVEVGRTIGTDYIVTGEVLRFGAGLRLNLKVHACVSGAFLGSEGAKGVKVDDLETGLAEACGKLFALVRTHAGVGQGGGGSGAGSDGQYGGAPEVWNPNARKKALVKFTSDPPGAMVLVDGSVLCQSTPCSKLVSPGTVQVQMQRERYAPRSEAVTIPAEGSAPAVAWTLEPQFGWLTVRTVPESLAVTINGEAVRAPVVRREVDPGPFDVKLSDGRYYETGERATVVTGAERTVTLAPTPREGAIEVTATDAQGNDVAGKVSVDGKPVGEAPGTYRLMVGKHRVVVTGASGGWQGDVTVAERQVAPVVAKLAKDADLGDAGYELLADGEIVKRGDLMWTVRDNGSAVNWNEAKAYCEACRVGGYSDWRMPTIEELEGLYVAGNSYKTRDASDEIPAHIAKPFQLTSPWQWSSTRDGSSSTFFLAFTVGKRYSLGLTGRYDHRVLCVRRSGE